MRDSKSFKNKSVVLTGASSGIGNAIALKLADEGANLYLIGRNLEPLRKIQKKVRRKNQKIKIFQTDLSLKSELQKLQANLKKEIRQVHYIIHSAGVIWLGLNEEIGIKKFDWQFKVNVRAPYSLTRGLLPELRKGKGQIVFINSSLWLRSRENVGPYAATKFALKAVADSLRDEVSRYGIRVLSLFLGRVNTPMHTKLQKKENEKKVPLAILQSEEVAEVVAKILSLPPEVDVTEISLRGVRKTS
jgi:short-subunit dehydrogenase